MERHLTLEAVRLTESAALYASRHMGKGDENMVFSAATDAMAQVLAKMDIGAEIVIGVRDENSDLKAGAKIDNNPNQMLDIALKPLDGKMTCARGGHNSVSIIAMGERGTFRDIPAGYMKKIAVGPVARGVVDINQSVDINIKRVARAKGRYIEDITVCVLDRPVNENLVEDIRKTGARIKFIRDGDISAAIATAMDDNPIDILIGVGGGIEGILAAAALRCLGGDLQAQFVPYTTYGEKIDLTGIDQNIERVYQIDDLVKHDDVMVSMTGVTDGVLLPGVRYFSGGAETHSIVLRQKTQTKRFIQAVHHFDAKPIF